MQAPLQNFSEAFTFDDVLLMPQYSDVRPGHVSLHTRLTRNITLKAPIISAAMDTVTEAPMAIALALRGGVGVIHKNNSPVEQAAEVEKVKRFENGFIKNPMTLQPDDLIAKADQIRTDYGYKKIPVVNSSGVLVGLLTEQDYFVPDDCERSVGERMLPLQKVVIAPHTISLKEANEIIRREKILVLCLVEPNGKLTAIVTRRDLEKNEEYPNATKDDQKRLRVGAAISVGEPALERAAVLATAGVDFFVVDVALGHSQAVADTIKELKKLYPHIDVIGGNLASRSAAKFLAEAGADAVKVGVGPGSICSTRVVAGIGVPQLTAVMEAVAGVQEAASGNPENSVPVIADGGIKSSGDIVKALAAGASSVMMGRLFAGTEESPGDLIYVDGHAYKTYRGMGSYAAMKKGSADRYGHSSSLNSSRGEVAAEGVVGRVPFAGSMIPRLQEMLGGIRAGLSYNGAATIAELAERAQFVRISGAGLHESHPHSIAYSSEQKQ